MKNVKLFFAALLALVLTSCEHKELCLDHTHIQNVKVVFDWRNAPDASPSSVTALFFPTDKSQAQRYNFVGRDGGPIRLSIGAYSALGMNNDHTDWARFRGTDDIETFEVYTDDATMLTVLGIDIRNIPRARETETERFASKATAVWGTLNYFTDVEFAKQSDGTYTSTTNYYWPGAGSIDFYAYYPQTVTGVTVNKTTQEVADFIPAAAVADQVDFVTAVTTGCTKDLNEGNGVVLDFGHRLSQIEIRAKSDNEQYTFKIKGYRIAQVANKATLTLGTATWSTPTGDATYTQDIATVTLKPAELVEGKLTAQSLMDTYGNAMLMPQQLVAWAPNKDAAHPGHDDSGTYLGVLLKITRNEDGFQYYPFENQVDDSGARKEYAWACVPISTNWQQGKKYVYTLDFTEGAGYVDPEDPVVPDVPIFGKPIKFTVEVDKWVSETNPAEEEDVTCTTD